MSTRSRFVALLLTLASIGAGRAAAAASWTVPGTVNASGLNGTKFVSDVTLTNPGTAPAQAVVSFLPGSAAAQRTLSLAPGQTVVSRNVVSSLFGLSGVAGALSISSDQALLVRARTYNTAGSGTYGVSLPVFADDRLLSPGDSGDAHWISQDASGSSGYRTNIALVFPDPTGGAATVTVYDADGIERGHQDYTLEVPGLQQFSVGSFAGGLSVARAHVVVTRGRTAGYAVVVDNVTGDSSLFALEDLPGGRQDVLVNGVARASGRNNAFFRTDGRFYNPTDTEATIKVSFHASGNANPSPATASFTLPAGKIRDVIDVLDTLLDLPVGSAGALRFQSDWPVAILCRTSNVDPSGARPGTFGSQQKPVPLLSFVTSADAGAAITGIRQETAFRTNVGFAAGADGATYALTLATADGATVATATGSLGAFGWTQPGVQDLFPTVTIPPDAMLRVKVTAGSLDAFDSSIDNLSGDPVVTAIAALPVAIPATATIGPAGGSIRSDDGRLTLRLPAGALATPMAFSIQTTTNDAPLAVGPGYRLLPAGIAFAKPALLTLSYGRTEETGSAPDALSLAATDGNGWYIAGGGALDVERHTMTVPVVSTSPAFSHASSRSPESARVDDAPIWAIVYDYQLLPSGRQAIAVGGQRTFVVRATGPSSTMTGEPWTPARPPADLEVKWFVNGFENGLPPFGVIVPDAAKKNARFTAPICPPAGGWVAIYAHLSELQVFLAMPFVIQGTARVMIVPRKYEVKLDASSEAICTNDEVEKQYELSDSVQYHLAWVFELDDQLLFDRATQTDFSTSSGAPAFCGRLGCGSIKRIDRSETLTLGALLKDGRWDELAQNLRFSLDLHSRGPGNYDMVSECGGYESHQNWFGGICNFDVAQSFLFNPALASMEYDMRPADIDTKEERAVVKVHLKVKAICP